MKKFKLAYLVKILLVFYHPLVPATNEKLDAQDITSADEMKLVCRVYSNNKNKSEGFFGNGRIFNLKTTEKKILENEDPLFVRKWSDQEIVAERKSSQTFDTEPPVTRYELYVLNRLDGSYRNPTIWRTDDGQLVNNTRLEEISKNHPLWQVPLVGIYQSRVLNGECEPLRQRF